MNLYILSDGVNTKIGITSDIDTRIASYHTHNPRFTIHAIREADETTARRVEKAIRAFFQDCRSSVSREWFTVPAAHVTALVDDLLVPSASVGHDDIARHAVHLTDEVKRLLRVKNGDRGFEWHQRYRKEFGKAFGLGATFRDFSEKPVAYINLCPDLNHIVKVPDCLDAERLYWSPLVIESNRVDEWVAPSAISDHAMHFYALAALSTGKHVAIATSIVLQPYKGRLNALWQSEMQRTHFDECGMEFFRHDEWTYLPPQDGAVFVVKQKTPVSKTIAAFDRSLKKWVIENSKTLETRFYDRAVIDICRDSMFPLDVADADDLSHRYWENLGFPGYTRNRETVRDLYQPIFDLWRAS